MKVLLIMFAIVCLNYSFSQDGMEELTLVMEKQDESRERTSVKLFLDLENDNCLLNTKSGSNSFKCISKFCDQETGESRFAFSDEVILSLIKTYHSNELDQYSLNTSPGIIPYYDRSLDEDRKDFTRVTLESEKKSLLDFKIRFETR